MVIDKKNNCSQNHFSEMKFTELVKCGYIFDTEISEVVPYTWGPKKVPL